MEAATGFEPVIKVLQTCALPLGYAAILLERKTRFELATPTLARWCSTTELLPHVFLKDKLNNTIHCAKCQQLYEKSLIKIL